jgi:serine phosphatase RsbU (regulator of sigma subunit)/anti-sigma regulatory factor (Ser/Thr protein kinase)
LAAQCAVALQRARMTEALIEGEKMRQALLMAREVQMSTLPTTMPTVAGYDVCGTFRPADLTGGDTFDLSVIDGRLLAVLGDATGHGIAPALSVTQMHAMLRMAFRLGADLETAFAQVNNQLESTLPDDRFITAFIGVLDPATHELRFHSGGQGPILHFRAATDECERYKPTCFPLGAMPLAAPRPAVTLTLMPGDILALVSDGIFEYENAAGEAFGERRVVEVLRSHRHAPVSALLAALLEAVGSFAGSAPQEDDMTVVLVKREPAFGEERAFPRSFDSIAAIAGFTADVFAARRWDPRLLPVVDLAVEELFTNMVKYSSESRSDVRIALAWVDGAVELTLTDSGVEPYDVSRAPEANVTLPLERREPGGLGLHLVRRMTQSVVYEYSEETRQSRTTVRIAEKR